MNDTLNNNTVECKKLATIVSGQKNIIWLFFRWKQVSTSVRNVTATYVAVTFRHLCLPVFVWRRVVLRFFLSETIVASFLHSMVLLPKVFFNQAYSVVFFVNSRTIFTNNIEIFYEVMLEGPCIILIHLQSKIIINTISNHYVYRACKYLIKNFLKVWTLFLIIVTEYVCSF